MHRMYKIWCDESNSNPVKYDMYRTIVNEKFNLKFQLPKKDRCDRCEAWENTKNEERSPEDIQTKKEHDDEKSLSRFYKTNIKGKQKNVLPLVHRHSIFRRHCLHLRATARHFIIVKD